MICLDHPLSVQDRYKSEALAAVHDMMDGLHDAGIIDQRMMCEFDDACLVPATAPAPDEGEAILKR